MTLYEKIKAMTLEEMAAFICSHYHNCGEYEENGCGDRCPAYDLCWHGHTGTLAWLAQEVK